MNAITIRVMRGGSGARGPGVTRWRSSASYAQMWDDKLVALGAKLRDGRIVDHLNGDRLNDRRLNLPFVTAAESGVNVEVRAASGYRGVYPNKSRWPPLTTVSTEPGLQAGSHDLR